MPWYTRAGRQVGFVVYALLRAYGALLESPELAMTSDTPCGRLSREGRDIDQSRIMTDS
ncbi:hypothetical protein HYPSUDRAFT_41509 [Hypholoma sublateritium FD-334 SS-4]|uniref:Uncharacterized protein n=1 Tax=Hypholoma sublateritium (strain FD-334 SS-4) TaxID=945553 RepID=A0A0D2L4S9_HYPSF|nr:hypothetical protein HYPSUDRAFT_41509 [Hypholoma sublateritium FD-334 SS-4]